MYYIIGKYKEGNNIVGLLIQSTGRTERPENLSSTRTDGR